jgi:hypothetical protein
MKLYGAIDLHSSNNVAVVIDEQDQVVYQKRLPNDLSEVVEQLSPYRYRSKAWWWSRLTIGTGWSMD